MISSEIFIECVAHNACESLADVILIELLDSHYRSVILAREPAAAFAVVSHRSRLRGCVIIQLWLTLFNYTQVDMCCHPQEIVDVEIYGYLFLIACREYRSRPTVPADNSL